MFYRLYRDPEARRKGLQLAIVEKQSDVDLAWRAGQRFEQQPPPVIRTTLASRGGPDIPDAFLSDRIPLFSQRLVDCLRKSGADNIDTYSVELVDAHGRKLPSVFHAVNIIGLISCMDPATSTFRKGSEFPMIQFTRLGLLEDAIGHAAIFRLAENPSFILVSERVKTAIADANLVNVRALPLDDRAVY